jgi:hypothetical protein
MPRKWLLTVKKRPCLADGKAYQATVNSVGRSAAPSALKVTLLLLDRSQAGRKVKVFLPLPVFADNLAGSFLRATGFEIEEGQAIDPSEAVGKTVRVRFSRRGEGDEGYEAVAFEAASQKSGRRERSGGHERPNQQAGPSESHPGGE